MATNSSELAQYLSENAPAGTFSPCAYYDRDSDALTFFLSNSPEYAKRLNSRVTAYFSDANDELIGCRIKGVRSILEDIGSFDVSLSHGKVKLKMLFVALHGPFASDPDTRDVYRRLGRSLPDIELEVAC